MSNSVVNQDRRKRRTKRVLLRGAIDKANKKNDRVASLVKFIRHCIADLEKECPRAAPDLKDYFEMLSDLIAPPVRKRGRPKGRNPSARAQMLRRIVDLVRKRERDWKKTNSGMPFYRVRRKLVAEVFAMPDDNGDNSFEKPITEDEVLEALAKGGSSR